MVFSVPSPLNFYYIELDLAFEGEIEVIAGIYIWWCPVCGTCTYRFHEYLRFESNANAMFWGSDLIYQLTSTCPPDCCVWAKNIGNVYFCLLLHQILHSVVLINGQRHSMVTKSILIILYRSCVPMYQNRTTPDLNLNPIDIYIYFIGPIIISNRPTVINLVLIEQHGNLHGK